MRNRFNALTAEDQDQSADSIYQSIVTAHEAAAEEVVPKKCKSRKELPWENNEVTRKRSIVCKAQKTYASKPTKQNKKGLNNALEDLKQSYDENKSKFIQTKISEITSAHIQKKSKLAWDAINEVSNCKKTESSRPTGENASERVKLWEDHFKNLLGQPACLPENNENIVTIVSETLPIPTHEFTEDELKAAIKNTSTGKACGLDNIPAEAWKKGPLTNELLTVCNNTLSTGISPTIWRRAAIIPIPKKGDLSNRQNYRGISLIPVAVKIYNKMLLNRLKPHLEKILRTNQNGFREGRSTVGQILALRRIIEEVQMNNIPAVLDFIDFRKAFDSISREKLFQILAAYGIPEPIIIAIKAAYKNTMAQVVTKDGNTEFFNIKAGVLQGDTLAPYLFIIMVDYIMRTATQDSEHLGFTITERQNRRHPATYLTDTDFADDIALLSNTVADAQKLLTLVVEAAKNIGLNINEGKTEYMVYNISEDNHLSANGKPIKK